MNISLNIDDLSTFVAVIQLFKKKEERNDSVLIKLSFVDVNACTVKSRSSSNELS